MSFRPTGIASLFLASGAWCLPGLLDADRPASPIGRITQTLVVTLEAPSLSAGIDTLTVTLRCTESADALLVQVIETSPGRYVSGRIPKDESPPLVDGMLSCRDKDIIRARHADPVQGTVSEAEAVIDEPVTTRLAFARGPADTQSVTALDENEVSAITVRLAAYGKSLLQLDTLFVVFTTPGGDRETMRVVETDLHTQEFIGRLAFAFVAGNAASENATLEGRNRMDTLGNSVIATASVRIHGTETRRDLLLSSAYVPASRARMEDADRDGAGDRVVVSFMKKLPRLPEWLEAQWKSGAQPPRRVTGASLSFRDGDSSVVVADYSQSPFPVDPGPIQAGDEPRVRLPPDPLFGGQTRVLEDAMSVSIGPSLPQRRPPTNGLRAALGMVLFDLLGRLLR